MRDEQPVRPGAEPPEEAAARYPELAERFRAGTEEDLRHDQRMLWRQLAVLAVVAAILIARAIWLV